MNKKIFVLAFVSAAFLISCSADNGLPSGMYGSPPEWDGIPSTNGPSDSPGGNPPPAGPAKSCDLAGYEMCAPIGNGDAEYTEEECEFYGGIVVDTVDCTDYSH